MPDKTDSDPLHRSVPEPGNSAFFKTISELDERLFGVGFNQCDIQAFDELIADDFEFYHDKTLITDSKTAFVVRGVTGYANPSQLLMSIRYYAGL